MTSEQVSHSIWDKSMWILCLLVFLYHMLSTILLFSGPQEHQIASLGMMLSLVFLAALRKSKKPAARILWTTCLVVGLACTTYMYVYYEYLQEVVGFPERMDMLVGIALLAVVLVGTWLAWGAIFPVLALVLLAYFFFGHLLPHPLYHSRIPLDLGISYLDVGLTGIFGPLLAVMANFGVILLAFGSLLDVAGANRFFLEIGKLAGRRLAGGPGQTAVVGSSLVGMVSGAAVGNVIITGSFTIPMMKEVGYRAQTAGAIEATASTGSQLMPPIMGIAAFLMAGFLGKDFSEIMIAGVVPSLLFYFSVVWGVQFIAKNDNVIVRRMPLDREALVSLGPLFVIPLGTLVILLMKGFSAGMAGFYVVCLVMAMMYLRPATRPSIQVLLKKLAEGVVMAAKITMAVATVGALSQIFISTGLAQKLAALVEMLSYGIPLITLFFTMLLALILGLGLPAAAAYALVAILVAPGLVQMGVEDIRAHFFAFYFAIVSAVTPPVALASLAASSISGASFMKTSWEGFKLSLPNFIIPFLIVYNPVFLLLPGTDPGMGTLSILAAMAALVLLNSFIYNRLLMSLTVQERSGMLLAALAFFTFCFTINLMWLIPAAAIAVFTIVVHVLRARSMSLVQA